MNSKKLADWLFMFENRYTHEIQLGLERVSHVAKQLNILKTNAQVITVAGTNGKGSTVALLESIYTQAGFQVGSYTSPHLVVFNERIKVNQVMISDEDLISLFKRIETFRKDTILTYFEITTLAALCYFQTFDLDIIILEVGLGGRLDATNIINNDLSIITTIDFDHQEYLGDTLEQIGAEKAGIIREKTPVIFADSFIPKSIINRAQELAAPLYCYDKDYKLEQRSSELCFTYGHQCFSFPKIDLHLKSIGAALMAQHNLQGKLPVTYDELKRGITNVVISGRFQWITHPVLTLLDVAHNPQAAQNLAFYLQEHCKDYAIYAVFSALKEKNLMGLVDPLKSMVTEWFPSILASKRSSSAHDMTQTLQSCKVNFNLCYNEPVKAYLAACKKVNSNSIVLVFGSFLTVGSILLATTSQRSLEL